MLLNKAQIIAIAIISFILGMCFLAWQVERLVAISNQITVAAEVRYTFQAKQSSGMQDTYNPQQSAHLQQHDMAEVTFR